MGTSGGRRETVPHIAREFLITKRHCLISELTFCPTHSIVYFSELILCVRFFFLGLCLLEKDTHTLWWQLLLLISSH